MFPIILSIECHQMFHFSRLIIIQICPVDNFGSRTRDPVFVPQIFKINAKKIKNLIVWFSESPNLSSNQIIIIIKNNLLLLDTS